MIIEETNRYAQQKNSNFVLDNIMLHRFLGILVLSGYHTVPAARDYWSNHPTLGVPAVKLCMPRNKFLDIKKFIHFSNNFNLDKNDKKAKIRPLYEIINKKFMQFGIWEEDLSVDEQMVP
ncbi:PiggyBac transposable element-derived protein 2 [Lucilia cuprina]|nr:PiggyBac transposable element-derived protein 2 [Lucilia cuprina]